jgi:hypothetical protein
LAVALTGWAAQACSDRAVCTETQASSGESSTTDDSGSGGSSTETTGEPLPRWALGIFSSEADKVGMSFSGNPYWWIGVEITASGTFFLDWYVCSGHQERQEFRWTLADDGMSLSLHPIPPAAVFIYGNANPVSEVIVEPGASCDTIRIRFFHTEAMAWGVDELQRGDVCARPTGPDGCTFTFEWCEGTPPPACE